MEGTKVGGSNEVQKFEDTVGKSKQTHKSMLDGLQIKQGQ